LPELVVLKETTVMELLVAWEVEQVIVVSVVQTAVRFHCQL
jgi:hypothetical protein